MNSNYKLNNFQENEIDKILQDGIDKSLSYINSFNMNNSKNNIQFSNKTFNNQNYTNFNNSNYNNIFPTNDNQNLQPIQIKKFNTLKIKPKSKSINRKKRIKKKNNILDYQIEYNKKKDELEKYKNQLIQERIKQNKLQKEMNSKTKKEEEFKKLEENTNLIKNNSEELISKIQRSEKIREEQSKLIDELLKEYNSMINTLRNNPGV